MCIAPEIFDGITKAVEGFFNVRAPVFPVKEVPKLCPHMRRTQLFTGRGKQEAILLVQFIQSREIFSFEFITQDTDRKKELFIRKSYFMVRSQSAARDDTVHMDMIRKLLIPGVEDLYDSGNCAQVLLILTKLQKSFRATFMEKGIKEFLVTVKKRVEFVRKCKDYMKIRGVNDFRASFVNPDFF